MITVYITEVMGQATCKILEDETYFGEIPGLLGVWSDEATLEEWLLLKLRDNEEIPPLEENILGNDTSELAEVGIE